MNMSKLIHRILVKLGLRKRRMSWTWTSNYRLVGNPDYIVRAEIVEEE